MMPGSYTVELALSGGDPIGSGRSYENNRRLE